MFFECNLIEAYFHVAEKRDGTTTLKKEEGHSSQQVRAGQHRPKEEEEEEEEEEDKQYHPKREYDSLSFWTDFKSKQLTFVFT